MLEVYTVTERGGEKKPLWTRIGSAWKNKDNSLKISLLAIPTNGQLIVKKARQRNEN